MTERTHEPFTASNAWRTDDSGALTGATGTRVLNACDVPDARQFFLEERDHELGRWRDPEAPHMVCYCNDGPNAVRVVDERSGNAYVLRHDEAPNAKDGFYGVVAARYFAAHPVKTIPTEPGLYVRKSEATDAAPDLWQLATTVTWSTDVSRTWKPADASSLPDDLVRLVPEEAE